MFVGLCANAKARVPPNGRAKATPVPAKALIFKKLLLLVIVPSKARKDLHTAPLLNATLRSS
jgi:hypothetical protein